MADSDNEDVFSFSRAIDQAYIQVRGQASSYVLHVLRVRDDFVLIPVTMASTELGRPAPPYGAHIIPMWVGSEARHGTSLTLKDDLAPLWAKRNGRGNGEKPCVDVCAWLLAFAQRNKRIPQSIHLDAHHAATVTYIKSV